MNHTNEQLTREAQLLVAELSLLADFVIGEGAGNRALGIDADSDFAQSHHPDMLVEITGMAIWDHVTRIEDYVRDQQWHAALPSDVPALQLIVERTFSPAVVAGYELERAEWGDEPVADAGETSAGDVPFGCFHLGIMANLAALASARLKMDQDQRLTMADIALLLDVREPTVVTNAHRKNFVSIEEGNRRYAEPAEVLPWMVKQGYIPTQMPDETGETQQEGSSPTDELIEADMVFVPVARDGTWFSPACRSGGRYTIGAKGEEVKYADYFSALDNLVKMRTPRWRRPNVNGKPGIVTWVRFDRVRRSDILKALA